MPAYYNEFDPFAAAWLRELIKAGQIAPGDVDERSIEDVTPTDLRSYTQCHFFAGIGVWSYALRRAGWSDDRPVWTGSCPCQPFSAAGKGGGFDDERHLWPAFHWLISQCSPPVVLGEQVASKDGLAWLDLVQADLEGTGYASGAVDTCAAGVGAPHIRQRLYWVGTRLADAQIDGRRQGVEDGCGLRSGDSAEGAAGRSAIDSDVSGGLANSDRERRDGQQVRLLAGEPRQADAEATGDGGASGVADSNRGGRQQQSSDERSASLQPTPNEQAERFGQSSNHGSSVGWLADTSGQHLRGELGSGNGETGAPEGAARQRQRGGDDHRIGGSDGRLANTNSADPAQEQPRHDTIDEQWAQVGRRTVEPSGAGAGSRTEHGGDSAGRSSVWSPGEVAHMERPGPTNGLWRDADWLFCRDGKWRPVEPGTFPLAHGAPARVGRLRGYGNALNAEAATAFVQEVISVVAT